MIEDFFRLLMDALLYYPYKLIPSMLFPPILSAALTALTLQQTEPLTATLHYLRDVLAYGGPHPPSSSQLTTSSASSVSSQHQQAQPSSAPTENPPEIRAAIHKLLLGSGETLVQRILTGMMFSFPRDCFPDASGVLLGLVELLPQQISAWIARTVQMLPQGTVSAQEMERLIGGIEERLQRGEVRKVRYLLQDFTNTYRRRNVAPREGLGRLEQERFRFSG